MVFEWVKDTADKAVKAVGDAGSALASEAQNIEHKLLGDDKKSAEAKSSDSTKPQAQNKDAGKDEKKPETATGASSSSTGLNTDQTALANAALKSVAKDSGVQQQTVPKYDGSVLDTISHYASQAIDTITSSSTVGTVLSYISNPISISINAGVTLGKKLVKVAEDVYETADKDLKIGKIKGEAAEKIRDEYHKLFDDSSSSSTSRRQSGSIELTNPYQQSSEVGRVSSVDDTASLPKDMMHWLFNDNEKPANVASSDNLFNFTNDKKETTDITAVPGHVHIEKTDAEGNVKTIVDKTSGRTMVLQGSERVTIENGKEVVKGDGYTVSWDEEGKRHITLADNREVIRDKDSVKLIDKTGSTANLDVKEHFLDSDHHFGFTNSADELSKITEEKRAQLKDGEAYMLAIAGGGTRTIFKDATFDVQNNLARLETKDHEVFQFEMKNNQIFIRKDGHVMPLNDERLSKLIKAEDGKYRIGNLVIDPKQLCLETDAVPAAVAGTGGDAAAAPGGARVSPFRMNFDFRNWRQNLDDTHGHVIAAVVHPDKTTTITDGKATYTNNDKDATVAITTVPAATDGQVPPKPETIKVDLDKTTIETNKIIDTPQNTTIKDTNTVIDADKTVHFQDGPTVNPDGTVRVDHDTFVDKDMSVHAKDWESSAASKNRGSITEANAQDVAISISSKANSIFAMARAGKVSWSEVAALNSSLGDVLSLMSSIPPDTAAFALLLNSYGLLVEAINIATPKAQITQFAMDKGISDPTSIQAIGEGANADEVKQAKLNAA